MYIPIKSLLLGCLGRALHGCPCVQAISRHRTRRGCQPVTGVPAALSLPPLGHTKIALPRCSGLAPLLLGCLGRALHGCPCVQAISRHRTRPSRFTPVTRARAA